MGITIIEEKFGTTEDGKEVTKYILENSNGIKVSIINYGASIQSIIVPDQHGEFADIALGYDTLKAYEQDKIYLGALCGRVANRVSNAQFTIDGVTYQLTKNHAVNNHIHGGFVGFNKKLYASKLVDNASAVEMTYTSVSGEEGYPGTLTVLARYELNDENELVIRLVAVATRPTPVNLVQHTYFNLAGHNAGPADIAEHTLIVNADRYATQKGQDGYPTGEMVTVEGTVFNFRKSRVIGSDLERVPGGVGYDHNLCLSACPDGETKIEVAEAAKLYHPSSGRQLEVRTNQPGLQVYTSYYLNGESGKDGATYQRFGAICLETQNYPDAINQPNFPNAVLRPEKGYHHEIVYKFSTE